ncbi:MAG: hypothetical protein ACYDAC_02850 [Candidatus Dormibacteria bacterium]
MLGRSSKTAVIDSSGSRAADVAMETAQELAARAMVAAREAQRVATPVIRSAAEKSAPVLRSAAERSAETLSHAAERAAIVLADTAERLAESSEEHVAAASDAARTKLADASEALADAVRPPRRHRVRNLVTGALILGGVVALVRSPLRGKIADRIFGAPPEFDDDEPEAITLPAAAQGGDRAVADESPATTESAPESAPESAGSNGVASGTVAAHGDGQG